MILCTPIHEKESLTEFEKLYMFAEADGEEEAPTRTNVKRIKLKVSDKRNTDFTKGADDGEVPEEDTPDDGGEEDVGTDEDIAVDDTDDGDMEEDMGDDEADDAGDDEDIALDDEDDTGDDTGDGEGNDGGGGVAIDDGGDDAGGGNDATAGADDGEGDAANPDDKKEAILKQNLYRKYMRLLDALDGYIEKIGNRVSQSDEINRRFNQVCEKLKILKDFIHDYMVIRYLTNSYTQSVLFYQRAVAATNIILDMIHELQQQERTLLEKKPTSK